MPATFGNLVQQAEATMKESYTQYTLDNHNVSKLNDCICTFLFLKSHFLKLTQISLTDVLNRVSADIPNHISEQLYFLSFLILKVADVPSLSITDFPVALGKISMFLTPSTKSTLKLAGQSLSHLFSKKSEYIKDFCDWTQYQHSDQKLFGLLRHFRWPSSIDPNLALSATKYFIIDDDLESIGVAILMCLDLFDNEEAAKLSAKLLPKQLQIIYTLSRPNDFLTQLPELLALLNTKAMAKPLLDLVHKFYTLSPQPAAILGLLSAFTASPKLHKFILADIMMISLKVDENETIQQIIGYFLGYTFSIPVLLQIQSFLQQSQMPMKTIMTFDITKIADVGISLVKFAYTSLESPSTPFILDLLNELLDICNNSITKSDSNSKDQLIASSITNTVNPMEQALIRFPFKKIERLCYYVFHTSQVAYRLKAYTLLGTISSVFKKMNDDWENYEPSQQPFIIQFSSENNFFIKKNIQPIITIEKLLETDEERLKSFTYLNRRMATNRQQFAARLLKEFFIFGHTAPFLATIAVGVFQPILLRKIGSAAKKPQELFDFICELKQFSAFSCSCPDHLKIYLDLFASSTFSPDHISLLDGITAAASIHSASMTQDLVDLQFKCVETILKSFPRGAHIGSLSGVFAHLAKQVSECTALLSKPLTGDVVYQYVLAAVQNDSTYRYPELFSSLLSLHLGLMKFDENYSSQLSCLLELPSACDPTAMSTFFVSVLEKTPQEQVVPLLQLAYRRLPNIVAKVLLDMNHEDAIFTLFCYLMSDKVDEDTNNKMSNYVKKKFPGIAFESNYSFPVIRLGLRPAIIEHCIKFFDPVSRNIDLQLRIIDVLLPWITAQELNEQDFNKVLGLAVHLSQVLLYSSPSLDQLWESILTTKNYSTIASKYFIEHGVEPFIIDYVYSICSFQEEFFCCAQDLLLSDAMNYLAQEKDRSLISLYAILTKVATWTPTVILATAILIQMDDSIVKLSATRFIRQMSLDVGKNDFEATLKISSFLEEEEILDYISYLVNLLSMCKSVQSFSFLSRVVIAFSILHPTAALTPDQNQQDLLVHTFISLFDCVDGDADLVSQHLSEFLEKVSKLVLERDMPPELVLQIARTSLVCIDLDQKALNDSVAALLVNLAKKEILKQADPTLIAQIIKLIYHGDTFFTKITMNVFPELDMSAVKDEAALFWHNVARGKATITDNPIIFNSLKEAIVFAGAIPAQKIGYLFQNMQLDNPKENIHIKSFVRFLLMSTEVEPATAISLVNLIERIVGQVDALGDGQSVNTFKKTATYIRASLSKEV